MATKRLLFVTQKVDETDDVLGFVHRWIYDIASEWESVIVICLYEGKHNLPSNVRVLSLGKENGVSRFKYVTQFYRYIFKYHKQYDAVLVHMNPEYFVLGGFFWKLWGKKTALWYSHKSMTRKLKIAMQYADIIFTTAKKSVTFESPKLRFMGHGIEINKYRCEIREENPVPLVLTVGRVTKIKHCETLIEVAAIFKEKHFGMRAVIAGGPATPEDKSYQIVLEEQVQKLQVSDIVDFTGSIPIEDLLGWYCKADISVNMVPTGGLDKSVLEGMAAGNLVMSSNEAFREYFGPYADRLIFKTGDAKELANKIEALWLSSDREEVRAYLTKKAGDFDVRVLVKHLSEQLRTLS